ncbi:hypothetical protein RND81_12G132000 [Saponaria officinalis]|uniref:Uncharacterized protein n=1 Tax=Saponaria officinalis TaxID=3572 RepID=A0AAW1HA06_SAPOF
MSCCLFMPKKLKKLPSSSKKAWNSFTSSISPKLRNLHHLLNNKLPKPVSKTASRLLHLRCHHHHRPFKGCLCYKKHQYHHIQPLSTVSVDKLLENNKNNNNNSNSNSNNNINNENSEKGNGSSSKTGQVKWKEYVSKLPIIRGIDERADEFILRFRQQMKLQREQSIIDFHDMLARST